MKLPAVTLLTIVSLSTLCLSEIVWVDSEPENPCNIKYQCSTESNQVWAADGNLCLGFRNPCFLASENCDRQNRNQPILQQIPRNECQDSCPSECPDIAYPVCGKYMNILRTFDNTCEMDKYSCNTGKSFELYNSGPCSLD